MFPFLYKYLVCNGYVSVPGIGQFAMEYKGAKLDTDANIIYAPSSFVTYKKEQDVADKSFYNFLAKELNIEVVEAIRQFQDFAFKLKNNLSNGKSVDLPSLGSLSMHDGTIDFKPADIGDLYFPPVDLHEAQQSNQNIVEATDEDDDYQESRKSYWWIWALILGVIGAAAIIYYYMIEVQ